MKKPSFFMIGAPKCGTTSLYEWLSFHPNIYMPYKEVHWFNQDHGGGVVSSQTEYNSLFDQVGDQYISALGEASVWYLYSQVAVKNICAYNENAKFIVMVRNPLEMAVSLHDQLYHMAMEDVYDFKDAWNLQEIRSKGLKIPSLCEDPKFLQYGPVCSLGEQVERLYDIVNQKNILVLLLDDFKENPRREYLKVLSFISVPDDGRVNFPVLNSAKTVRFFMLAKIVGTIAKIKTTFGIRRGVGGLRLLNSLNKKAKPRKSLDPFMFNEMAQYFESDVKKLGDLINRDLSDWLER